MTMPTTTATDDRQVIPAIPPLDWKRTIPRYRISRETLPSPKERYRFEQPFSSASDASTWQFGEKVHLAGEVIETTFWPNPGTMTPLNYSALQVINFFTTRQKSRLPRSPWANGEVRLDDGLTGTLPKILGPQVQPVGVQPAGGWPSR
jgi:hypothetical protein